MKNNEIRTPRANMHLADRIMVAGQPMMKIKRNSKEDYMTVEEIAEAIYGKKVERIIFKKDTTDAVI